MKLGVLALGLALSALAVPVSAHHSWTAEYDAKKPIKVSGTVSKVDYPFMLAPQLRRAPSF